MRNPYEPPATPVEDRSPPPSASWPRTLGLVLAFAALSQFAAWFIAPGLAQLVHQLAFRPEPGAPPAFLVLDLAFSFLAILGGCYAAASLSRGQPLAAAAGVGLIGWLVYFVQAGGVQGMVDSEFPGWYEAFPTDLLPAVLAGWLLRRGVRRA